MNSDEHMAGAFVFYLIYWTLTTIFLLTGVSIGNLIFGSFFAILGGLAPDILEPPTWWGHRGVFHWLGFLSLIPILLATPSKNIPAVLVSSFFVGYLSHFVLDYLV